MFLFPLYYMYAIELTNKMEPRDHGHIKEKKSNIFATHEEVRGTEQNELRGIKSKFR